MYQLQIWGPKGRRVLRWDPDKLQKRDPVTLAAFAEADKLLREALTRSRDASAQAEGDVPCMAASGRWIT